MSRELRIVNAIDLLDESLGTVRSVGTRVALRAWGAGAILAGVFVALFYFERVESIRSLRSLFAFLFVLAWCARVFLLRDVAARYVEEMTPGSVHGRASVGDTLLTALIFGLGLWCWLWLPALVSLAAAPAAFGVMPFLACRSAIAPSWLARLGVRQESAFATWLGAIGDSAGQRATGLFAELLVYLGAFGLAANLYLLTQVLVYSGRAYLGLDLALVDSFLSGSNEFVMVVLVATTLLLFEPLRAAMSATLFVSARARKEGLDLAASIDLAVAHTAKKTKIASAALICVALSLGARTTVHAQDMNASPDDEAREHAAQILAQSEYREFLDADGQSVGWWERLVRWLKGLERDDSSVEQGAGHDPVLDFNLPSGQVFIVLGIVLLVVVLVALLFAYRKNKEGEAKVDEAVPSGTDIREKAPAVFLDEAALLASRGLYRDALRSLYLATLVSLDRRRLISFESHLTNWQYMRQMPRNEMRELFGEFTREFDFKWYGQEPTTEDDYTRCRALADRICAPSMEQAA